MTRPMKSSNSSDWVVKDVNNVLIHPFSDCVSCGGTVSAWQPADVPRAAKHLVRYCTCCGSLVGEFVEGVPLRFLEGTPVLG